MALRVLIFQTDIEATRILEEFFSKRGDHNWRTDNETQALDILALENPDLVLVDLHAPEKSLFNILGILQKSYPETRVIVTNKYPDLKRELLAKERGVKIFLREPFTSSWIENALIKLSTTDQREKGMAVEATTKGLPKVRVPVRLKITFPYVLLALVFAVAITLLVSRTEVPIPTDTEPPLPEPTDNEAPPPTQPLPPPPVDTPDPYPGPSPNPYP